jgi:hypothetical protein
MAHRLDAPVAVVVDATGNGDLSLTLLARLARLRRFHRVVGGELVLAACEPVAELLRRTGLLVAIPCFASIPDAVTSLRASPRRAQPGSQGEEGRRAVRDEGGSRW